MLVKKNVIKKPNKSVEKHLNKDIHNEIGAQSGYKMLAEKYEKLGEKGNARRIKGIMKDEHHHEGILKNIKSKSN